MPFLQAHKNNFFAQNFPKWEEICYTTNQFTACVYIASVINIHVLGYGTG